MFFSCPISSVSGRAGRRRRGLHWVGRGRCPVPVFGGRISASGPQLSQPSRRPAGHPQGRNASGGVAQWLDAPDIGVVPLSSGVVLHAPPRRTPIRRTARRPAAQSGTRDAAALGGELHRRRAGGSSAARRLDIRPHRQGVRRAKPPAPLVRKGRAAPGVRRGSAASPSPEPNVRTLGRLAMTPNGCHSQPPCLLICRPSVSLHRPELRRRPPGSSRAPVLSLVSFPRSNLCPASDVRPCRRSRPDQPRGRCARSGEAGSGSAPARYAAQSSISCRRRSNRSDLA